jgi:hypothetical protein
VASVAKPDDRRETGDEFAGTGQLPNRLIPGYPLASLLES